MKKQLLSLVTLMSLYSVIITPSITQAQTMPHYNIDNLTADLDNSENVSLDDIGNLIQDQTTDEDTGTDNSETTDPDTIITHRNIRYLLNQANTDIEDAANTSIDLQSAPSTPEVPEVIEYSLWEQIHRQAMLQGFEWVGDIAQYIDPKMYIGTTIISPYNTDTLADMNDIDTAIELSSATTETSDTETGSYDPEVTNTEDSGILGN